MTEKELEVLAKALAPAIREYVEREIEKVETRAAERNRAFLEGLNLANSLRATPPRI